MTGQIAFARTIRALDADNFRASKIGSFFAILLLAAWTWWFFASSIPQCETSANLEVGLNSAVAYFPSTRRIHSGQPAQITLSDGQIIKARVEKVTNEPTGAIRVQLNLIGSPLPRVPNPQPQQLTTSIEVARSSPASIVLRTIR